MEHVIAREMNVNLIMIVKTPTSVALTGVKKNALKFQVKNMVNYFFSYLAVVTQLTIFLICICTFFGERDMCAASVF